MIRTLAKAALNAAANWSQYQQERPATRGWQSGEHPMAIGHTKWAALVLAVVLSSTCLAGERAKTFYNLDTTGNIVINPDGTVLEYTLKFELPPTIAAPVDRSIRSWRFQPVTVGGSAVSARTRFFMSLIVEPVGDHFQLRIADLNFGGPVLQKGSKAPQYPRDAAYAGVGAKVIVVLKLDSTGAVSAAHAYQVSLNVKAPEKIAGSLRRQFELASTKAAMDWKFELTEDIPGQAPGMVIQKVVQFVPPTSDRTPNSEAWRAYVPGPNVAVPWLEPDVVVADADAARASSSEARLLSPRFRLIEDAVGKVL